MFLKKIIKCIIRNNNVRFNHVFVESRIVILRYFSLCHRLISCLFTKYRSFHRDCVNVLLDFHCKVYFSKIQLRPTNATHKFVIIAIINYNSRLTTMYTSESYGTSLSLSPHVANSRRSVKGHCDKARSIKKWTIYSERVFTIEINLLVVKLWCTVGQFFDLSGFDRRTSPHDHL